MITIFYFVAALIYIMGVMIGFAVMPPKRSLYILTWPISLLVYSLIRTVRHGA